MTVASELSVELNGKEVGLSALLTKVDAQTQKAADSALRLQAQYARLAQSQGNTAGATSILSNALQNNGGASEKALVGVATQLENVRSSGQGVSGIANQLAGSLGGLANAATPLAAGFVAIGAAQKALDFARTGAEAGQARLSFDQLAAQAHTTGDALLSALQNASHGEINKLNLELAANRAQLLGVAHSAEEFSTLMDIARDRAQKMGITTAQAFDNLVTGLGRGSPLILDNLGLTINAEEANAAYAASIGKTASALSEAEKKQAVINAALAQGKATIAATGGAVDSAAGSYARLAAAWDNAKTAAAGLYGDGLAPVADATANVLSGIDGTAEGFGRFASSAQSVVSVLQGYGATTGVAAQANQDFAASVIRGNDAILAWYTSLTGASIATGQVAAATQQATDIEQQRIGVLNAAASVSAAAQSAALGYADALAQTGIQARAAALAAEQKANADQVASVDAQTHAVAQQQLAQQAQTAAQALLLAGGQGAATAATLANSSSQVDVLTAAYYRLLAAQRAAGAGVTQQQTADFRSMELFGQTSSQRIAQIEREKQADAARSQQILATGSATQRVTEAERLYNDAVRQSGKNSAAAIEAETRLMQTRQQAVKAGGGGRGGGAAAVKLSAQQKLQNTLLGSAEQYEQKADDLEAQHAQKRLDILQDYNDKVREATRDFEQDQLEGRASFYDNLGSIESQKIAQAASAAYEQAAVEAGKIATEKGADVADKYMQAQEQIISARAKRQSEIEKAAKDDKAKAEYLKGVDAQYRQAEDAKLARIKEGEGSLASERDKRLAEEDASYGAQADKLASSAEASADRRIAAAQRAGQAIDAEAAKANALGEAYNKIAPSGAGAQSATGTTTSTATPATPTTTAAPVEGENPVVAAINGARDALLGGLSAIERAAKETTGAVRALPKTGGIAG